MNSVPDIGSYIPIRELLNSSDSILYGKCFLPLTLIHLELREDMVAKHTS
jgi:hypothetical protein